MGVPQLGQREPGLIMDCPRGTRQISTFVKLPTAAPNKKRIKLVNMS